MVGSPGHRRAREVLCRRLRDIGCEPWRGDDFEMPYEDEGESFCNLAGVVRGRDPRLAPLLVGAHYDSVIDAPCADDNAAAVAIALAVAEHLKESRSLDRDLVVAIFDAEEPPYFLSPSMGSWRFWEDQRDGRQIHAAVIMDLVGHDVSLNGMNRPSTGRPDFVVGSAALHHRNRESSGATRRARAGGRHRQAEGRANAEPLRRRRERSRRLSPERRALLVPVLRPLGALPPEHRHTRSPELRQDGAHHPASPRLRGRSRQH